jgi:hypothetical protein
MKIICSAFREKCNSSANALCTADLIQLFADEYQASVELCIGHYCGKKEISLIITNLTEVRLSCAAKEICKKFHQEYCYCEVNGDSYIYWADKEIVQGLGKEYIGPDNGYQGNRTELLDGRIIYCA